MVCAEKRVTIPYGVVETGEGGVITAMREKPAFQFLTNTGLYLVEPEVLEDIGEDEVIGFPDIIERQRRKGRRVSAYTVGEADWLDMGQLDELEKMAGTALRETVSRRWPNIRPLPPALSA